MNALETLLSKRWIVKSAEKDLYYRIKDQLEEYKKFIQERLGYQLIVNPYVIKLEKIPASPQLWMGITEFTDKIECIFFCIILMYLEDKEVEEQFVLSSLTEYIQMKYQDESIDWTLFQNRRHLVKVIKFCLANYILQITDGTQEDFMSDYTGEVLYENTGVSRYLMRGFTQNILNYTTPSDFENSEWIDANEERGIIRRQRVYRKLLMTPGVYKESEEDEDFIYIKQYRGMIAESLGEYFDCELQVHKTSAFMILGEECGMGRAFPAANTLSDILLLCFLVFHEKVDKRELQLEIDESVHMSMHQFRSCVEECRERFGKGFNKSYREMTGKALFEEIQDFMEYHCFIQVEDEEHVIIRPIVGKLLGDYPEDFKNEE